MPDFARSDDPAVQAQLDRLALLSPGGDRLGLERITRLLDRLGRPQDRLPPVFHVAGTNGKGSTCAFLRAALEAAGRKVHVFTSPHLVRFNERIRIAGKLIEDDALAALLGRGPRRRRRHRRQLLRGRRRRSPSSPSRARRPTLRSSRSGSAAGSTRPTSIERPLVCGHRQRSASTISNSSATSLAEIAAEKAGIAKRGRAAGRRWPRRAEAEARDPARRRRARSAPSTLEGRDWTIDPTLRSVASRRASGPQRQPRLADAPAPGLRCRSAVPRS